VCVRVAAVGRLRHEQGEQWGSDGVPDTEAERAASELLDALGNRLGPGRVLHVSANESHLPERAFEMCETSENRPKIQDAIAPTDRPTVFFDYPIPAEVIALTPDGPVHHVRWRDGYESTVACFGPERISGEWWVKSDEATKRRSDEGEGMSDGGRCGVGDMRDYFRVQSLSGRWLWVYRAHAVGRWFVHGVWG
jgi:protein ImuB